MRSTQLTDNHRRQGLILREGQHIAGDHSDQDRIDALRDITLDFGRGMWEMAADHARTNKKISTPSLHARLSNDAKSAYGVSAKDWLDNIEFNRMPLVPRVTFSPSPRPDLKFAFRH